MLCQTLLGVNSEVLHNFGVMLAPNCLLGKGLKLECSSVSSAADLVLDLSKEEEKQKFFFSCCSLAAVPAAKFPFSVRTQDKSWRSLPFSVPFLLGDVKKKEEGNRSH